MFEALKEMWEIVDGGEVPQGLVDTAKEYFSYKRAVGPVGFDVQDAATCVMLWKIRTEREVKRGGKNNG